MSVYSISAASTAITNLNNLAANKQARLQEQRADLLRRMEAETRTESMIEKKLFTDQQRELETNSSRFEQKRIQDLLLPEKANPTLDPKTPANGLTRAENRPGSMRYDRFRELVVPEQPQPDDSSTIGAWLDETV